MLPPSAMTQMGSQLPFSLAFNLVPASHALKFQVLSQHDAPLKCEAKAGLLQHSGLQSILSLTPGSHAIISKSKQYRVP